MSMPSYVRDTGGGEYSRKPASLRGSAACLAGPLGPAHEEAGAMRSRGSSHTQGPRSARARLVLQGFRVLLDRLSLTGLSEPRVVLLDLATLIDG